eukprot:4947483-Pleurochrysis_carterae.AAC.1
MLRAVVGAARAAKPRPGGSEGGADTGCEHAGESVSEPPARARAAAPSASASRSSSSPSRPSPASAAAPERARGTTSLGARTRSCVRPALSTPHTSSLSICLAVAALATSAESGSAR